MDIGVHEASDENDVVIGIQYKKNNECWNYVSPPNHSTFAGPCEYEQDQNTYTVYDIDEMGNRYPSTPYIYVYSESTNTFNVFLEDAENGESIVLFKYKH